MARCTRWYLPLLLLPLPTAPPFFLVLFLFSLTMHAKPCFYCIILLTTLFVSSCYWQPLPLDTPLSVPWADNITTFADALNSTLSTSPEVLWPTVVRPVDRCWCDITNGNFFEPFNVSNWEYLSVQRAIGNVEKRVKMSRELVKELMEPLDKLERDLKAERVETGASAKIWSALNRLSPSLYTSLVHYMDPQGTAPEVSSSETELPPVVEAITITESTNTTHTTHTPAVGQSLIRKEYDLRPYGFGIIVDFGWSR